MFDEFIFYIDTRARLTLPTYVGRVGYVRCLQYFSTVNLEQMVVNYRVSRCRSDPIRPRGATDTLAAY